MKLHAAAVERLSSNSSSRLTSEGIHWHVNHLGVVLACYGLSTILLASTTQADVKAAHSDSIDINLGISLAENYPFIQSNVTYRIATNYENKLDVYVAKDADKPRPTVIFIHGGGWGG